MELVYKNERTLFIMSAVIATALWLAFIVGTLGVALVYILFVLLIYLFAQSAFISYLKGTAVRITPEQFPDLHQRVVQACKKLGMEKVPEAYLLHGNGIFNAFATRFLGRNFIALYSDVVDALAPRPDALDFYIGHELGHIHRRHLVWAPLLWPASLLPLLGAAYSRAREYTCDLYGLACCKDPQDACYGLAALAAGGERWQTLSTEHYVSQTDATSGFWMSFHELIGDYPWLVKRMEKVRAKGNAAVPRIPRRNPLAWILALFFPRLAPGAGAGALLSLMIVVAILGIMAAIALPAYQDYVARAGAAQAIQLAAQVKDQVNEYVINREEWPSSNADIDLGELAHPQVYSVDVTDEGVVLILSGPPQVLDGKSFVWEPYVQDQELRWGCTGGTLEDKYRPAECRTAP
jgi:Zn-dependent protease with chaperone function/competence protein ComGC